MVQQCCFCSERTLKVIYIKQSSFMYVAFLDASNAFDWVNHTKLFSKLLKLGVPMWIIKVLCISGIANSHRVSDRDQCSQTSFLLIMV